MPNIKIAKPISGETNISKFKLLVLYIISPFYDIHQINF